MFSGKSDLAIGRVRSFSRVGLSRVLYQPKENSRDVFKGSPVWSSRAGGDEFLILPAKYFDSPEKVLEERDSYDLFGFEEWQMYSSGIFEVIRELHNSEKIVVAAGLDYYFNGEPVEIFDKLRNLDGAVLLQGVGALCQDCLETGKKNMAMRTQRTYQGLPEAFDAKKIIVDGSKDYDYKPVCFKHWKVNPPKNSGLFEDYNWFYLESLKTTRK
jgi:thymidine kinase